MGTTQFPTVVRRWLFQKPRHPTPTGRSSSGRDERPKSRAGEAPAEPPSAGPRGEQLPAILRSSGDRCSARVKDAAQQELRPSMCWSSSNCCSRAATVVRCPVPVCIRNWTAMQVDFFALGVKHRPGAGPHGFLLFNPNRRRSGLPASSNY